MSPAGGPTPLIGALLAHRYPGQWWPLTVFYSALAAISLVCITTLERNKLAAAQARIEAF